MTFSRDDPKSREWRKAFRPFLKRLLTPFDDVDRLKQVHHIGWRAGVKSVRSGRESPAASGYRERELRQAWDHGAVAGRRAAQEYIEESGTKPGRLR